MRPLRAWFAPVACLPLAGLLLINTTDAGITVTGDVSPNPPGAGAFVEVGITSPGSLMVDGGSTLPIDRLEIGAESVGRVTVTDPGSSLTVQGDVDLGTPRGIPLGVGRLSIEKGAHMDVAGRLVLGGSGRVGVSGTGSVLTVGELLGGVAGLATINIVEGGTLIAENGTDFSASDITVQGDQSLFKLFGTYAHNGSLVVSEGGAVSTSRVRMEPSSSTRLIDGTISASSYVNLGRLKGTGSVTTTSDFVNDGTVETGAGESLRIVVGQASQAGPFGNLGKVLIDGGEIELLAGLQNLDEGDLAGSITLRDGDLRVTTVNEQFDLLNRGGTLAATGGTNDLHGRVLNDLQGSISVTSESVLVFHDHVENQEGEISVMPGSRAVFLDGLDMPSGTLLANVAGTDDDTGFGIAEVVGTANLAGQVTVALSSGFEPALGDRFGLLTASGGITGQPTLDAASDPGAGLRWELETGPTTLALLAVPELDGDFNLDGSVDAADYTVWRDGLGTTFDQGDYDTWRDNYGATLPTPAQSVPEPGSLGLLSLGCVGAWQRARSLISP